MNGADLRFRKISVGDFLFLYDTESSCIFATARDSVTDDLTHLQQNSEDVDAELEGMVGESHEDKKTYPAKATLVVTNDCVLRCKYCVYSEDRYRNYGIHQPTHLDFDLAMAFLRHYLNAWEKRKIIVDFFGGEPLLEFALIKRVVSAVESEWNGREIAFALTTNGVLLNRDVTRYLVDHNFACTISVDGTRQLHDRFRIFRNGTGSYEVVSRNIEYIEHAYPDFFRERVNFVATVARNSDVCDVLKEFDSKGWYRSLYRGIKPDYAVNEYDAPRFQGIDAHRFELFVDACKQRHFGRIWIYGADLLEFCMRFDSRTVYRLNDLRPKPWKFCRPYENWAILQTDGTVSFCNIIETERFGQMATGQLTIDEQRLRDLHCALTLFYDKHCTKCFIRRICNLCWAHFIDCNHQPNEKKLVVHCLQRRKQMATYLKLYLTLKLMDPGLFHDVDLHGQVVNEV
jgi:sulfatase maturation enzyme AslB (radical SAM superfamily)